MNSTWFTCWPASNPDIPLPADKEDPDAYHKEEGEIIARQKKVRMYTCHTKLISKTEVYQCLKDWFNNNTSTKLRNKHPSCKPFQIQMKPHCRPQYIEIYSCQYYDKCVRDKVRAEIKDKGLTRKKVLMTIKQFTAEVFEAELTELKNAIYAEAAAKKTEEPKSEEVHTPESYAAYVLQD